MLINDVQPISKEDLRRELIRRKQGNRQLIKHFREATQAVEQAVISPMKLKDGQITVGMTPTSGWFWIRHDNEEQYDLAADEAINTIVQILMLYD